VAMSRNQLVVMAACLAISNMGMKTPSKTTVSRLKRNDKLTLDSAVLACGREYMETDEQFEMFMDEAEGFVKKLRKDQDECRSYWEDVFELYEKA